VGVHLVRLGVQRRQFVDPLQIELPRRDARTIAVLHEGIDGQCVSVPRQRPREILTIALLNDDSRGARPEFGTGEIRGAVLIRGRGKQIEKSRGVGAPHDLLDSLQDGANLHIVGIVLGGCRSRECRTHTQRTGTLEARERSNERRDNSPLDHP